MPKGEHRVIVMQNKDDDFPHAAIECSWGSDDPDRPCRMVDCNHCAEYSSGACLADPEHDAHVVPGCGVQEWMGDLGPEGVVIDGLRLVSAPVASIYFDEGWHLTFDVGSGPTEADPPPSEPPVSQQGPSDTTAPVVPESRRSGG